MYLRMLWVSKCLLSISFISISIFLNGCDDGESEAEDFTPGSFRCLPKTSFECRGEKSWCEEKQEKCEIEENRVWDCEDSGTSKDERMVCKPSEENAQDPPTPRPTPRPTPGPTPPISSSNMVIDNSGPSGTEDCKHGVSFTCEGDMEFCKQAKNECKPPENECWVCTTGPRKLECKPSGLASEVGEESGGGGDSEKVAPVVKDPDDDDVVHGKVETDDGSESRSEASTGTQQKQEQGTEQGTAETVVAAAALQQQQGTSPAGGGTAKAGSRSEKHVTHKKNSHHARSHLTGNHDKHRKHTATVSAMGHAVLEPSDFMRSE